MSSPEKISHDELPELGDPGKESAEDYLHDIPENAEPVLPDTPRPWWMKFLAGENRAGKIGGKVKDLVSRFIPGGPLLDYLTDIAGDELKEEKPRKKHSMKNMKDPKTTITGIITVLLGIGLCFGIDTSEMNPEEIASAIIPILIGLGLLSSRDNKRKDED